MKQDLDASGGTAANLQQVRLAEGHMTLYPLEVRTGKRAELFLGSFHVGMCSGPGPSGPGHHGLPTV